jgi:MFS transporter, SHS family, lactate transporter
MTLPDGTSSTVPDYGTVQGILIGVVAAFVFLVTLLGPENHGSEFERHRAAFVEGGGEDDVEDDVFAYTRTVAIEQEQDASKEGEEGYRLKFGGKELDDEK